MKKSEREHDAFVVREGAASAISRGHPWIYATQVTSGHIAGRPDARVASKWSAGDEVVVRDRTGAPLARALVDPGSPIAARVWTLDVARPIDASLVAERVQRAIEVRERRLDETTTALRLVHGEGDRAPGLVVDRYGNVAVMRLDGAAMEAWTDRIAEAIFPLLQSRGVRSLVVRSTTRGNDPSKIRTLRGEDAPDTIEVREHGVPFLVDLAKGQKTGAFLDQRENRVRVGALSKGKRVLNLFSYAGGFSLHAALGGATAVTSVDVAAAAHVTAQKSFALAGVSLDAHDFVTADVWDFLERARARKETWDVVVSDPPSMAPSESAKPRAMTAYRKLHAACVGVLARGGTFCASSCSSHVHESDFLETLDDRSLGRSDLRVVEIAGAGADHPALAAFPEGRYLKFCVLT